MIGVGDVLDGRYELRGLIGTGGMGAVYRAFDRRLEREVAIKALLPQLAGEGDLLTRFMREARALAGIRHPNIVTLHDLLTLDEGVYLVLDLVPGHSLEEEIRRAGPMRWERCVDLGTQVCGGLAAIHAQDVIHRDIKPSNILVEPGGVYRVADFGLARLGGATQVTRTGAGMGTPGYWAPEQAGGGPTDGRADLFSLGAVLYAAATGYPPLVSERDGRASDPRRVVPELPDAAAEVVMRAMAPDPADRYASAMEMARALRSSADLPLNPVTPIPPAETLPPADAVTAPAETRPATQVPPPGRPRGKLVGAAVALIAIAGLTGVGIGSLRDGGTAEESASTIREEAGAGSIAVPEAWSTDDDARLPGEDRADGLTAEPARGSGETLTMVATEATGPNLLPPGLVAALEALPGRPDRVRLGSLVGYRHRELAVAGDPLTVFVVPTSEGVQTIACSAPAGRFAGFAPRCEAAAGTLQLLEGVTRIPLGPSKAYATAAASAVERLNTALPGLRQELVDATSRTGQADAASRIASAYTAAADRLRDRRPGPEARGLNREVVDALDRTAAGYGDLAAATVGDSAAYAAAREAIAGSEEDVRNALRALERAGYEVTEP